MSDKRKSEEKPQPKADKGPGEEPAGAVDPKKIVFKIVSADPKNTLNFEDVADK